MLIEYRMLSKIISNNFGNSNNSFPSENKFYLPLKLWKSSVECIIFSMKYFWYFCSSFFSRFDDIAPENTYP